MLLEDLKQHEKVCIKKYQDYANQVQDPQLKDLLNNYAQQEQNHLNSINEMLGGRVPSIGQGQQGQQSQQSQQGQQNQQQQFSQTAAGQSGSAANQNDAMLLNDLLMTEKYVSSAYDTAIFEFIDPQMRQALNHIQQEEQQHGEGIFNYMSAHGMYNTQ